MSTDFGRAAPERGGLSLDSIDTLERKLMRLSPPPRPRRRPAFTPTNWFAFESRALMTGVPGFAEFQGALAGTAADAFPVQIRPGLFKPGVGGQVLLRFEATAGDGSALDPGPTALASGSPWGVRVLSQQADAAGGSGSVTVAAARPGALTVRPTAQGGTAGAYALGVSLAGDVNGDNRVDLGDLRTIRAALGRAAGSAGVPGAADVNGDGLVGAADLALASRNLGAATSVRPLDVTAGIDPSDDPNGDGRVDAPEADVVGVTKPGSTVYVDLGANGTIDRAVTAGADGRYRVTVPLAAGANPVAVGVADAFGQRDIKGVVIVRSSAATSVTSTTDFTAGAGGWQSGFADLPVDPNDTFELDAGVRPLPAGVGSGTGYLLQGHNRSDDLFMYLTKSLGTADGIVPGQSYTVSYTIRFASNAPSGGVGIGGSPGESVVLKAGATGVEPQTVVVDGYDRLNVDIGNQIEGGPAASVVGNIANGIEAGSVDPVPYVSLTREHTHTAVATADAQGNLWLLVGLDSGYEGLTAAYFQQIDVTLTPVAG